MKNVKFLITIVPVVIIDYVINMLLHRQSTILGSTLNEVLVVDIITIASVVFYMVFLDTIYMKRFSIGLNLKYYFTGILIYCIFDIAVVQLFLYNSVKYDGLFYAGLAVISLYARLYMLKRVVDISIMKFNEEVVIRVVLVALFMFLSLFIVEKYTHESFFCIIVSLLTAMILSILIGLKKQEIIYVYSKIIKKR